MMVDKMIASPRAIFSFFAGSGFLDLGFEKAGFDVVFANELNESFADAYRYSRAQMRKPLPRYGVDVRSIDDWLNAPNSSQLKRWIRAERLSGRTVGFIGGPPCPDFSIGGKNRGHGGDNGRLTKSYFELIKAQQPDWFLFENVKGLWQTKRHRAFYDEMKEFLLLAGYSVADKLINAIEYGVPQNRERVILIGLNRDLAKANKFPAGKPIPYVDFPWSKFKTFEADVFTNYPWPETSSFGQKIVRSPRVPKELTVIHWFMRNSVENHPNSVHAFRPRAGLRRFETIDEGDDSRKSFKRLHRWRYSPTACYGNNEVHLHPTKPRRLSVAEVLAIQSLPKEFQLPPNMTLTAMFKTVGNGVPFLAAYGLARLVKDLLR